MPNADKEIPAMLTDDEIGEQLRGRGLEEAYIRELMATLGFDPNEGFTNEGIEALDNATMDVRRKAALRTLALAPHDGTAPEPDADTGTSD
jgi:hypothetical protein